MKSVRGFLCRFSVFSLCWVLCLGCGEKIDNPVGLELLPRNAVGEMPSQIDLAAPLDVASVQGQTANKGTLPRIYVGSQFGYEMRALLGFMIDLPASAEIISATLRLYSLGYTKLDSMRLDVHRLSRTFLGQEATYEQAANGIPWTQRGGDFLSPALGSGTFVGTSYDTVTVVLDAAALNDFAAGQTRFELPLIVFTQQQDLVVSFIAQEYSPGYAVASKLDLAYLGGNKSDTLLLERRAFEDATIIGFQGELNQSLWVVGEVPRTRVLFSYDLSGIPARASINQARLTLAVSRSVILDSLYFTAYSVEQQPFVLEETSPLVQPKALLTNDTVFVIDVTPVLQKISLGSSNTNYFAIGTYNAGTIAGLAEFYPDDWPEVRLRPRLKVVYTPPAVSALP